MGQCLRKSQQRAEDEHDVVAREGPPPPPPPPATPPGPLPGPVGVGAKGGDGAAGAMELASFSDAEMARVRLEIGEITSWKTFATLMMTAHYREVLGCVVEVEFNLLQSNGKWDDDELVIQHKFNFNHRVTPNTLCGLWDNLQTFCANPYYSINDYLVFYDHVFYCKPLCIKSITYYLVTFY